MASFAQTLSGMLYGSLMPSIAWAQTPEPPLRIYASAYGFSTQWHDQRAIVPLTYGLDVPFSNSLDKIDMAHTAYLDVAKGRWGGYLDKQYFKATVENTMAQAHFRIKAKMDRHSLGGYVTLIGDHANIDEPGLTLAPTAGLHFTAVDVDVKARAMGQTFTASRSASWREPYVGARFAYNINRHWVVFGQTNIGSRRSKEALAYVAYRSKLFQRPISLRLGYRRLDQHHTKDDFVWAIQEKNLMLGFSMQLL